MTTSSTSPRSSASAVHAPLVGTPVDALWTAAADGDRRGSSEGEAPAPVPPGVAVRSLTQVHGASVVAADAPVPPGVMPWAPGPDGAPPRGDALVASGVDSVLLILSADCASVALGSPEGVHAAVHAGWRGLRAQVLARAVEAMRAVGASEVVAGLGPCIGPCCYEFSPGDLDALAATLGTDVRRTTTWGRPSLDLPAAVRGQLSRCGVSTSIAGVPCTMCTPGYFSHRGHGHEARQGLFVWRLR